MTELVEARPQPCQRLPVFARTAFSWPVFALTNRPWTVRGPDGSSMLDHTAEEGQGGIIFSTITPPVQQRGRLPVTWAQRSPQTAMESGSGKAIWSAEITEAA